jgi:signal transduction histidine kinase
MSSRETTPVRILIVDDEVAQMKALCETLRSQGYDTVGFSAGNEALAELQGKPFDLLLADLMMPGMDGISLLRAALQLDGNLVGIIMTGQGTIDTAVQAMKAGALDYILKPFKLSAILPVLDRALTVRRLRLENAALERRVLERTNQLEAANRELEAFSFSVSHDLHAPLRHVIGYIEALLESESLLSGEGRRYLTSISRSAQRMQRLIDDLLNFSRTSRAELRLAEVRLDKLLEEVLEYLKPEIEGRNILWTRNTLPQVKGDPSLLRQVFNNLLLNAVKYSRTRNPAKIEIGWLDESDEEKIIFVRDNGVGFDLKYAGKLFGAFQRLHRQDEFEGTGIGLANVRRIIARHGGRTWAEGKVDGGATFYFSLPKQAVNNANPQSPGGGVANRLGK